FLAAYRRNQEWLLEVPPPLQEPGAPDLAAAARVRERAIAAGRDVLADAEARKLLAAFGIGVATARAPLRRGAAHDARVAVHRDAVFGPVIGFGAAGAHARELSLMLPPLSRRLARDLVSGAKFVMPSKHGDALEDVLLEISALVCALPWLARL